MTDKAYNTGMSKKRDKRKARQKKQFQANTPEIKGARDIDIQPPLRAKFTNMYTHQDSRAIGQIIQKSIKSKAGE